MDHQSPPNGHTRAAGSKKAVGRNWNGAATPKPRALIELDASVEVVKPIPIVIEKVDKGYIARFVEANVNAPGDTRSEARNNLELLIVDTFENYLSRQAVLGSGPQRQLAALQTHLRQRSHAEQAARR